MKKLIITILLLASSVLAAESDSNDVIALRQKIQQMEKQIDEQQHTIDVAKKNIRKLRMTIVDLEKEKQKQIKVMKSFVDSNPVQETISGDSFSVGEVYYIKTVEIMQHRDDFSFLATIRCNYKDITAIIQGFTIPHLADNQTVKVERVMRIARTETYDTTLGGTNTVYVFTPVDWSEVTFVKKSKESNQSKPHINRRKTG